MQRAYALFAAFRVDVAAGGLGYGDVFRSPRLRVNLAAEAPLVGLRAVGFPIADSIPVSPLAVLYLVMFAMIFSLAHTCFRF